MKASVLTACAALAFAAAAPASAANVSRPAPYFAIASSDWSGWRFGVQGGTASSSPNVNLDITGFGSVASASTHGTGATGGVFAGYYWQSGSLVYGLEGDYNFGGARASVNMLGVDGSIKTKSDASARVVLGYAVSPQLLLYATGGVDVGRFSFNANDGFGIDESWTTTKTGWTAGLGADYRFNRNWFAGLQYRYTDFGTLSHDLVSAPGLTVNTKMADSKILFRVGWKGNLF